MAPPCDAVAALRRIKDKLDELAAAVERDEREKAKLDSEIAKLAAEHDELQRRLLLAAKERDQANAHRLRLESLQVRVLDILSEEGAKHREGSCCSTTLQTVYLRVQALGEK